jgi:hypothetical protein
MKFKVGEVIEWAPKTSARYAAEPGAKAEVMGSSEPSTVIVKWLDEKSKGQCNGAYYVEDFKSCQQPQTQNITKSIEPPCRCHSALYHEEGCEWMAWRQKTRKPFGLQRKL